MSNRERAERRRNAVAYKACAKRHGVWLTRKYIREFQRMSNLRANRNLLDGIPF